MEKRSLKIHASPEEWHLPRKLHISPRCVSSGDWVNQHCCRFHYICREASAMTLCLEMPSSRGEKNINPTSPVPGPPCSCPGQQTPWKQFLDTQLKQKQPKMESFLIWSGSPNFFIKKEIHFNYLKTYSTKSLLLANFYTSICLSNL